MKKSTRNKLAIYALILLDYFLIYIMFTTKQYIICGIFLIMSVVASYELGHREEK